MDTSDLALLILRLGIGLTFAAHGAQKVFGWWGGPGMTNWRGAIASMGFRPPALFALVGAWAELGGGLLLAVGLVTPFAAAVLIAQSIVIIFHVHWSKGFFGAQGGYEFPLALGVGAVAVGLMGPGSLSLDRLLGLAIDPTLRGLLVLAGLVAGAVALAVPRLTPRREPAAQP